MNNWKAIAQARGLEIPAGELDRMVAPLESLEETFRPLVKGLTPDLEPSFTFRPAEESE
jgi:hypothetical protein